MIGGGKKHFAPPEDHVTLGGPTPIVNTNDEDEVLNCFFLLLLSALFYSILSKIFLIYLFIDFQSKFCLVFAIV